MICPSCITEQPEWADSCLECGASLSFLRDHPHRVGVAVWACMIAGLWLLIVLFATVFERLLTFRIATLGRLEAAELMLGIVLSLLGARAWGILRDIMRRQRLAARSR